MDIDRPTVAPPRTFDPSPLDGDEAGVDAVQITAGGAAPAVYRVPLFSRAHFQALWSRLAQRGHLALSAVPPRLGTRRATLVFDADDDGPPLCMTGRLSNSYFDGVCVEVESLPLSWRLGAVELARRLDTDGGCGAATGAGELPSISELRTRRLKLRPDVAAPAHTIAPTAALRRVVIALRARFFDVDQLVTHADASAASALPFLAALYAAGVVEDVPPPLECGRHPFSLLSLHWSAHEYLVHRNYRGLRTRLDAATDDGGEIGLLLERAYELLRCDDTRQHLRRELVAPPTIGEVTTYFRSRLEQAIIKHRHHKVVDLARRVLELDPTDYRVRRVLNAHQKQALTP